MVSTFISPIAALACCWCVMNLSKLTFPRNYPPAFISIIYIDPYIECRMVLSLFCSWCESIFSCLTACHFILLSVYVTTSLYLRCFDISHTIEFEGKRMYFHVPNNRPVIILIILGITVFFFSQECVFLLTPLHFSSAKWSWNGSSFLSFIHQNKCYIHHSIWLISFGYLLLTYIWIGTCSQSIHTA